MFSPYAPPHVIPDPAWLLALGAFLLDVLMPAVNVLVLLGPGAWLLRAGASRGAQIAGAGWLVGAVILLRGWPTWPAAAGPLGLLCLACGLLVVQFEQRGRECA